jgi:hypothetical protein
MLDGDPDLGKSLIALDLCARLSTGRPFPDGRPGPGPTNTLVLSAEDNVADTIVPRLCHLGADLARVTVWQRERDDEAWPWRFPADVALLDEALRQTDARLAVIDPIMAFLDDRVLYGSDQSVRRALNPLIQLAERHRCALLMHRHLNKQSAGKALYRGLGSIAFVAAARIAMVVGRDPSDPGRCVLAQVRNSAAPIQPSLAYQITGGAGVPPSLNWLGTTTLSADDLVGVPRKQATPSNRAVAFLEKFLAEGPRTTKDVWEAAQKERLPKRTLQRAKAGLDISTERTNVEGRAVNYWALPGQTVPGSRTGCPELDQMIAELEKQFPPPNPLDAVDEDEAE